MTDFQINDHILHNECESLAGEIFGEVLDDMAEDETPDMLRDDMYDKVHERTDSHEWVIYYHKALMLCAHCHTDDGEEWLSETGFEWTDDSTIYTVASAIAFGEMRARVTACIDTLIDDANED